MSGVFDTIVSSIRRPSAVEIDRSETPLSQYARPGTSRSAVVGTPSNLHFVRMPTPEPSSSSRSTSTPSQSSLRPLTLSNIDFINKKLPTPPGSEASSMVEIRESVWRKVFRLGISLDFWVRFIVILSFCEAVMAFWGGMQIIISGKLDYGKIWLVMTVVLLCWSVFFGAISYCGFSVLWGRFSYSPTAIRVMRMVAMLLMVLYGIASGLWFFYGFQSATKTREMCVTTLVFWDGETLPAPQPWVDLCLRTAESFERLQVAWGFMNAFQVYFMLLLVQWTSQHEQNLQQQKRWSRNSGLTYSDTDNSFDRMSDVEANETNFEKALAERVQELARQEKMDTRQSTSTIQVGMSIPNFPMPGANRNKFPTIASAPSSFPENAGDATKLGYGVRKGSLASLNGRFSNTSAMSGAIPIALDLRNLNSPSFYGRAF
ncbi:hypothetical protein TWF730_008415 [Orbilia blumenaviensis]|uniref:Uncharacterized protein n=1 Tax=Orbilia blumenaviensis TaxID=1796055 RepID=A0AAV9V4L6_9PEZI